MTNASLKTDRTLATAAVLHRALTEARFARNDAELELETCEDAPWLSGEVDARRAAQRAAERAFGRKQRAWQDFLHANPATAKQLRQIAGGDPSVNPQLPMLAAFFNRAMMVDEAA
jgi:hypothetical protein